MKKYIPSVVEPKWQKKWNLEKLYQIDLLVAKEPYYLLVEFTYPSGDLHIGHWFAFAIPDILGRFKRMQGFDVFYPNGFDAFGLPAENAAIARHIHPRDWTLDNIAKMREQFGLMGAIHDWENTVITCESSYYHWNQWIFLKMYEKGLAYKQKALSNWCTNCQTVLANENVESGRCWRCHKEVIQKEVDQWFLKITDYADKLIWPEVEGAKGRSIDWPKAIREGQNNWIGRSEGIVINFNDLKVFTTRPDTLFGATFVVISPEHQLLGQFITSENEKVVKQYVEQAAKKTELQRKEITEKTGVFTGSFVKNPINKENLPVWIADYVLMGYGTGAIMAVPAHDQRDFEFAKKYDLPIKRVIDSSHSGGAPRDKETSEAYEGEGVLINSGQYNGLTSQNAKEKISNYIDKHNLGKRQVQYHLHDWSISRQRYWGTPIPIIYCDKCGTVPVPEKDLPVELPYKVDYTPKGKPPLATAEDWLNTKCPRCEGKAKREAETMDTFVDSSWYFLRYLDNKNKKKILDPNRAKKWLPVNIYFGGAEHTLGHTLYSRFFVKFLKDIGVVDLDEYALKRVNHGVILGSDGQRMSKSHGNVVNPDDQVKEYGADAVRLYLAFIGPYDIVAPWNPDGIHGVYNFLQRVWGLQEKISWGDSEEGSRRMTAASETSEDVRRNTELAGPQDINKVSKKDLQMMHKTIKKVTEDVEGIKFNTAVAGLMEWLNYLSAKAGVQSDEYKTFLLLLAPFAPHITEELWQELGMKYSIHQQPWPEFNPKYLEQEEISIPVSVNGKVRDIILIQKDVLSNKEVVQNLALESPKIKKYVGSNPVKKVIYVPGKILNIVV